MNPIQAAEDVLDQMMLKAKAPFATFSEKHDYAALTALLTHARTLEAELARKTVVADAYWEIIESYRAENAELRAAWATVRAEIERLQIQSSGIRWQALEQVKAILAQHTPQAGKEG